MGNDQNWNEMIGQACLGNEESVNKLTQQAEGKIRAYIYRVTLDNDLSDDLTQETLLQMIKSIKNLNEKENFWPWMYRIAQSKVQEHYRGKQKENVASEEIFYKDLMSRRGDIYEDESVRELIQQDLLKKVMVAMKELKQKHRAVLSLRCFDNLSYAEIADTFNCNEVTARILFYRARKALRKKLSNKGISKNMMIMSLGLFGRLTLSPEASKTIPGEPVSKISLKVDPTTRIIGNVFSKQTAAVLAIAIIIWMLFSSKGSTPATSADNPTTPTLNLLPLRNEINSYHFTVQVMTTDPNDEGSLSRGAYERWFYFPEGVDGPVFIRMQRYKPDFSLKQCSWIENREGSYYYNCEFDVVHILNYHYCWPNLKVRLLPSDSQELIDFIKKVEGEPDFDREYLRDERTGLVVSSIDNRFDNAAGYQTDYEYNKVPLDIYEYYWDEPVETVVDERDAMHKRGWTYLRIEGKLKDKKISGRARIPFIYNTCKDYSAWISLNIGDELKLIDCSDGAQMQTSDGTVIASYPAGTFLKGLLRPWMGMHTADVIRRDAAEKQIWFFSEWHENEEDVVITLFDKEHNKNENVIYTVSFDYDIIKNIIFASGQDIRGTMEFTYLQDLDHETPEFKEPVLTKTSQISNPDTLWIMDLAEGKL